MGSISHNNWLMGDPSPEIAILPRGIPDNLPESRDDC